MPGHRPFLYFANYVLAPLSSLQKPSSLGLSLLARWDAAPLVKSFMKSTFAPLNLCSLTSCLGQRLGAKEISQLEGHSDNPYCVTRSCFFGRDQECVQTQYHGTGVSTTPAQRILAPFAMGAGWEPPQMTGSQTVAGCPGGT